MAAYDEIVKRFGDSTMPILWWVVAAALADKGTRQAELGLADEALSSADALERRLATLSPGDEDVRLQWRMLCVRARALSIQTVRGAAMDAFRSAYAAFRPDDDGMLHEMLRLVSDLVASGTPAHRSLSPSCRATARRPVCLPPLW